jgi:hypothetical protein
MIALPFGQCRSCGDAVSYFARSCPTCHAANLPNPVATIAALGVVVLIGGVVGLGLLVFRGNGGSQSPPQAGLAPGAANPASDAAKDYGWVVAAMAECDEEAKQKLDSLHFLIIPVIGTGMSLPGWSPVPISDVGDSATLLNSTDAMIGLRNSALVLYQKPLAFAISDPAKGTVYKWKPAVGVTALKTREPPDASFKLGLEIPDVTKEIEWGPTIALSRGTCYWINPLVRPHARGG